MAVRNRIIGLVDLTGKVALVTGGARERGLGRHIAEQLAEAGAKVMIMDIRAEEGVATTKQLVDEGLEVKFVAGDVRNPADCRSAVEATLDAFAGLDILVNDAALCGIFWTDKMPEEEWDRILDTNIKGTHLMCQAALAVMLPRSGDAAKIINIGSIGAFQSVCADNMLSAYNASKAAVVMYTKSLAKELLSKNVYVNCVAPGNMPTNIPVTYAVEKDQLVKQGGVFKKQPPAPTEQVAHMVLALASRLGDGMRGQTIVVDGGNLLLACGDEYVPMQA